MPFKIGLDTLSIKKAVSHVFFLTITQKLKLIFYDSLPIEKILTLHNIIMHTKSVLNKDQNDYYFNTFLGKCFYQLARK